MGKNKKKPEKISYMTPRNKLYCYFPGRVKEQTVEENKALYEELKNKNTNGIHSAADTMTELREPPDSTEEDDAEDIREFVEIYLKLSSWYFISKQMQYVYMNFEKEKERAVSQIPELKKKYSPQAFVDGLNKAVTHYIKNYA